MEREIKEQKGGGHGVVGREWTGLRMGLPDQSRKVHKRQQFEDGGVAWCYGGADEWCGEGDGRCSWGLKSTMFI